MRIVSQNGLYDILYDFVTIILDSDSGVIEADINGGDQSIIMAQYSSLELAEMAMQQLHAKYQMMNVSVFQFPSEESLMAIRNVERGGWVD